jgi:hypothetical protein
MIREECRTKMHKYVRNKSLDGQYPPPQKKNNKEKNWDKH